MYSHTQNENGTYNTRCLDCFMTIASSIETEAELHVVEGRHICPEMVLAGLFEQEKAIEANASHRKTSLFPVSQLSNLSR